MIEISFIFYEASLGGLLDGVGHQKKETMIRNLGLSAPNLHRRERDWEWS